MDGTTLNKGAQAMNIDLTTEQIVPLREAAELIPGRPHYSTLRRWQHAGLRGVCLETVLIGGRCFTSREAIRRFFERTNTRPIPTTARPLLPGLLDGGEVLHLIAPPQCKASWLTLDLTLAFAAGRPWLGMQTAGGKVLYVDHRLHPVTFAFRLREVAKAQDINLEAVSDSLHVDCLRGSQCGVWSAETYFSEAKHRSYRLIIIDGITPFWRQDCRFFQQLVREKDSGVVVVQRPTDAREYERLKRSRSGVRVLLQPDRQTETLQMKTIGPSRERPFTRKLRWEYPLYRET
jgi:hypothetical protein